MVHNFSYMKLKGCKSKYLLRKSKNMIIIMKSIGVLHRHEKCVLGCTCFMHDVPGKNILIENWYCLILVYVAICIMPCNKKNHNIRI